MTDVHGMYVYGRCDPGMAIMLINGQLLSGMDIKGHALNLGNVQDRRSAQGKTVDTILVKATTNIRTRSYHYTSRDQVRPSATWLHHENNCS